MHEDGDWAKPIKPGKFCGTTDRPKTWWDCVKGDMDYGEF